MAENYFNLGTVTPIHQDWRFFDHPAFFQDTYRFSFSGNFDGRSYLLIRPFYVLPDVHFEEVFRLWPSESPIIKTIPFPAGYVEQVLAVRNFSVKKAWSRRSWRSFQYTGVLTDEQWNVTIQSFEPSQKTPTGDGPGEITLRIE